LLRDSAHDANEREEPPTSGEQAPGDGEEKASLGGVDQARKPKIWDYVVKQEKSAAQESCREVGEKPDRDQQEKKRSGRCEKAVRYKKAKKYWVPRAELAFCDQVERPCYRRYKQTKSEWVIFNGCGRIVCHHLVVRDYVGIRGSGVIAIECRVAEPE